jgi:hypothetical protein
MGLPVALGATPADADGHSNGSCSGNFTHGFGNNNYASHGYSSDTDCTGLAVSAGPGLVFDTSYPYSAADYSGSKPGYYEHSLRRAGSTSWLGAIHFT